MLSRILRLEFSQKAQFSVLILCSLVLTRWWSGSLADTSIYYGGGERLFNAENPYDGNSQFFSAPTGAKFLFLVGNLLSITNYPFIWQIVNILGLSLFFFFVLNELGIKSHSVLFTGLLLICAPVREMVVNNQITGYVLGLGSLSILITRKFHSQGVLVLFTVLIYLSFELKPNLLIGLLIYFLWKNRKIFTQYSIFLLIILQTLLVVMFHSEYVEWFSHVTSQGAGKLTGFESLGLSTLVYESDLLSYENARYFGLTIFIISALFYVFSLRKQDSKVLLFLIPLLTLTFPYIHLLDLVVALPLIIPSIFRERMLRFMGPAVIAILVLPRPSDSIVKNSAIMVLVMVFSSFQYFVNRSLKDFSSAFLLGILMVISNFLLWSSETSDHSIQNFTVTRVWLLFMGILSTLYMLQSFYTNIQRLEDKKST